MHRASPNARMIMMIELMTISCITPPWRGVGFDQQRYAHQPWRSIAHFGRKIQRVPNRSVSVHTRFVLLLLCGRLGTG